MGVSLVRLLEFFGELWGSFWTMCAPFGGPFGPCAHPLGVLWVAFESFGWFFQHFSLLLGASGHYGVPFSAFVSPLGAFGVTSVHFMRILKVLCSYSSGIPSIFL